MKAKENVTQSFGQWLNRGGQLLRIRHSHRILLTVLCELDGFEDLVGFFREYARHHHLIFCDPDDFGELDASRASKVSAPSEHND
jgi:hypothetical protein